MSDDPLPRQRWPRWDAGQSPTAPRVAADDLRGFSHLSAAARSVLALSLISTASGSPTSGLSGARPQPDPASVRRFEVVKSNLGSSPHSP
jgi:hypothetical protein